MHGRRTVLGALVMVLVAGAVGVTGPGGAGGLSGPAAAASGRAVHSEPLLRATPMLHRERFADPSVASYGHGYVAVATGYLAPRAVSRSPRGPWHRVGHALTRLPHWARSPQVWAADLVQAPGRRWLLYYSAVAHGHRRCIGVAVATRVVDPFRPVGHRPLVCPDSGAIDPSGFTRRDGRRYLLFKTQGNPATIRLLRLSRDGRHRAAGGRAHVLLRSHTTIENPILVRHRSSLVLFTSEGYFGSCDYRTTWRRSHHLLSWGRARPHPLLARHNTRICGPGGADVLTAGRKQPIVYFHGWTCGHGRRACPAHFELGRSRRPWARRVMYAAHLHWRAGSPHVWGFVRR